MRVCVCVATCAQAHVKVSDMLCTEILILSPKCILVHAATEKNEANVHVLHAHVHIALHYVHGNCVYGTLQLSRVPALGRWRHTQEHGTLGEWTARRPCDVVAFVWLIKNECMIEVSCV